MNNTSLERLKKDGEILTWLVFLSLVGIVILFAAWIIIPPVSADATVLQNGTFYWRNITPQNNIYENTVMPGDTIVLGRVYDLTKVYGYSGQFAHWNDSSEEGMTCHPDIVNSVNYVDTQGKIKKNSVYLDPKNWTTGDWLQWEGCYQKPYNRALGAGEYVPYIADDNLMFTIITDPHPPTIRPTPRIPTIPPTVTIATETPFIVTPTIPAPVKEDPGMPWWIWTIIFGIGGLVFWRLW